MRKLALLFSGQGSQYVGMGKKFFDRYPLVRDLFEEANEIMGFDLKRLCFEGDIKELTKTQNTQPAILVVSIAMYRAFIENIDIESQILVGHSLGELSALTCAGAIDFADAIKIVRQRSSYMQEAVAEGVGAMAAVNGINSEIIDQVCSRCSDDKGLVVSSNFNSPEQIVISGHNDTVANASEILKQMGGQVTPLKVSAPFHSPLMKAASEKFVMELHKYEFHKLKFPVISNVTALPYQQNSIIENLVQHLVKPVQWKKSMEYLNDQGVDIVIEIGPGTVLRNLMKRNIQSIPAYAFDDEKDYVRILEILNNENKNHSEINNKMSTVLTKCLAIAVCTPNKNWDNDEYKRGVLEPYKRIREMQEEIETQRKEPTREQIIESLEMLRLIFITKKTPIHEQIERFEQIFSETGDPELFKDFDMPKE